MHVPAPLGGLAIPTILELPTCDPAKATCDFTPGAAWEVTVERSSLFASCTHVHCRQGRGFPEKAIRVRCSLALKQKITLQQDSVPLFRSDRPYYSLAGHPESGT